MFQDLLEAVPTPLLIVLVVGCTVGLVLLGVWAVRRLLPQTREGFDAEVSSQMLGVVSTLFGLLLAFVVVIEFQAYADAQDNVREEADSLAQVVRDSGAFSQPGGDAVRAAVGEYARAVVDDEWPRLATGGESDLAWKRIDDLYRAMQAHEPRRLAERSFYDDAVRQLNAALAARRDRLAAAGDALPALIVALLLVGAVVMLAYATLVGSRSAGFHAVGAAAIAVVIGFTLVAVISLDSPFSGSLGIEPDDFRSGVLARFFGGS